VQKAYFDPSNPRLAQIEVAKMFFVLKQGLSLFIRSRSRRSVLCPSQRPLFDFEVREV
jgi:hypothetical protein